MLGWSFTVKETSSGKGLGHWEGGLWSDKWLQKIVENGKGELVKNGGGYPNVYRIQSNAVPFEVVNKLNDLSTEDDFLEVEVWDQS